MSGAIEAALISSAIAAAASVGGAYMTNQSNQSAIGNANQLGAAVADANRRDQQTQYLHNINVGYDMDNRNKAFASSMLDRQQAFSRETYDRQLADQTRLSNTAYQRAVEDMRAAGLNPILAYKQGGAGTPGVSALPAAGATPSASPPGGPGISSSVNPQAARVDNVLGGAVGSAMQAAQVIGQVKQMAAQTTATEAQGRLAEAEAHRSGTQAALNVASAATEAQRERLTNNMVRTEEARTGLVGAQTGAASAQGVLAGEQTRTEQERQSLLREQGRQASSQANLLRQQEHNLRTYGPPGPVSSTVGGISQIWNSIVNSLR